MVLDRHQPVDPHDEEVAYGQEIVIQLKCHIDVIVHLGPAANQGLVGSPFPGRLAIATALAFWREIVQNEA